MRRMHFFMAGFFWRWLMTLLAVVCVVTAARAGIIVNLGLMSPAIHREVGALQALINAGKYSDALTQLNYLKGVTTNSYEDAVIHELLAQVYQLRGDYRDALPNLERALNAKVMPPVEQQAALLALGKLYVGTGEDQQGIAALQNWLTGEPNPSADALITLATAYAKANQCPQAALYARRAVQQTDAALESWYQLWLGCLYQARDYSGATEALYALLGRWPDKVEYWRQLSEVYAQLGDNNRALAVYVLMHRQGLIKQQQDYLNLISLYMQNQEPYQAAQLLQGWLDAGTVTSNEANYNLLAGAWLAAREQGKAITALGQAAKFAQSGEPYLQQAQIYQRLHEWFLVITAAGQALAKGGLKQPGRAYLLQGVAQAQNKQFAEAGTTLKQAVKYDETRAQAEVWLHYVSARLGEAS